MTKQITRHPAQMGRKAKTHAVDSVTAERFSVLSGATGNTYQVEAVGAFYTCTCDWHKYHSMGECSHVIAVRKHLAKQRGEMINGYADQETFEKQHRKFAGANDGVFYGSRKS